MKTTDYCGLPYLYHTEMYEIIGLCQLLLLKDRYIYLKYELLNPLVSRRTVCGYETRIYIPSHIQRDELRKGTFILLSDKQDINRDVLDVPKIIQATC